LDSKIEIRKANDLDLPKINKIYNQAVENRFYTADTEIITEKQRENWFKYFNRDPFCVCVAHSGSQILGWISLRPYRDGRGAFQNVAEISYYVDQTQRGKGIGTKLIEYILEYSKNQNIRTLLAILLSSNSHSIYLLQKYNFEKWGCLPQIADFGDRKYDHLIYGLPLNL
jgi:phosphinothricin acetyltransferase